MAHGTGGQGVSGLRVFDRSKATSHRSAGRAWIDHNQLRLLLSSAAYVLVESLRRLGLSGTELAHAQAGTIRCKLLKIGARIYLSARRIVIHLPAGYPLQDLSCRLVQRLQEPHLHPT